jgi:tetratricopeptide (TPR) repeat protein
MAERFLYVPLFGIAIIIGWLAEGWIKNYGRKTMAAGGVILAGLSLISFLRTMDWRDDLSLWKSATRVEPGNAFAWACRGEAEMAGGDLKSAALSYETAVKQRPPVAVAFTAANNLGQIYNREGRPAEALAWSDKALVLRPDSSESIYNRIVSLALLNRNDEALAALDRVEKLQPENPSWILLREKLRKKPSPKK